MPLNQKIGSIKKAAAALVILGLMAPSPAYSARQLATARSETRLQLQADLLDTLPAARSEARAEKLTLRAQLQDIAKRMVPPDGGILAADESTGTAGKRLESVGLENTYENRQRMRELILTVPGQETAGINSVILYKETFDNVDRQGRNLVQHHLLGRGILPGIKTDEGLIPDPDSPEEMIPNPKGLEGLPALLEKYKAQGAVFTKWRTTQTINTAKNLPTDANIRKNAEVLAKTAKITQAAGLVPIVEPEVLLDGDHDITASYKATTRTLQIVFETLIKEGVWLDGVILKTSMILSGNKAASRADHETVGYETLKGLLKSVPAQVAAIVFLSGGQGDDEVVRNLDAVIRAAQNRFKEARDEAAAELKAEGNKKAASKLHRLKKIPRKISFSFGRGLQRPGLKVWAGKDENFKEAQATSLQAAQTTQAARLGRLASRSEVRSRNPFARGVVPPAEILQQMDSRLSVQATNLIAAGVWTKGLVGANDRDALDGLAQDIFTQVYRNAGVNLNLYWFEGAKHTVYGEDVQYMVHEGGTSLQFAGTTQEADVLADVTENTGAITRGQPDLSGAGGTSVVLEGPLVKAFGGGQDELGAAILMGAVPPDKMKEYLPSQGGKPLDPDLPVAPQIQRLLNDNGIKDGSVRVRVYHQSRKRSESEFLVPLKELTGKSSWMSLPLIKDGTMDGGVLTILGPQGQEYVTIATTVGSTEGVIKYLLARLFDNVVVGLRLYSPFAKNIGDTVGSLSKTLADLTPEEVAKAKEKAKLTSELYEALLKNKNIMIKRLFTESRKESLRKIRPWDADEITSPQGKLFHNETLTFPRKPGDPAGIRLHNSRGDVIRLVEGVTWQDHILTASFSIILSSATLGLEGPETLDRGLYRVQNLAVERSNSQSYVRVAPRVVTWEELTRLSHRLFAGSAPEIKVARAEVRNVAGELKMLYEMIANLESRQRELQIKESTLIERLNQKSPLALERREALQEDLEQVRLKQKNIADDLIKAEAQLTFFDRQSLRSRAEVRGIDRVARPPAELSFLEDRDQALRLVRDMIFNSGPKRQIEVFNTSTLQELKNGERKPLSISADQEGRVLKAGSYLLVNPQGELTLFTLRDNTQVLNFKNHYLRGLKPVSADQLLSRAEVRSGLPDQGPILVGEERIPAGEERLIGGVISETGRGEHDQFVTYTTARPTTAGEILRLALPREAVRREEEVTRVFGLQLNWFGVGKRAIEVTPRDLDKLRRDEASALDEIPIEANVDVTIGFPPRAEVRGAFDVSGLLKKWQELPERIKGETATPEGRLRIATQFLDSVGFLTSEKQRLLSEAIGKQGLSQAEFQRALDAIRSVRDEAGQPREGLEKMRRLFEEDLVAGGKITRNGILASLQSVLESARAEVRLGRAAEPAGFVNPALDDSARMAFLRLLNGGFETAPIFERQIALVEGGLAFARTLFGNSPAGILVESEKDIAAVEWYNSNLAPDQFPVRWGYTIEEVGQEVDVDIARSEIRARTRSARFTKWGIVSSNSKLADPSLLKQQFKNIPYRIVTPAEFDRWAGASARLVGLVNYLQEAFREIAQSA